MIIISNQKKNVTNNQSCRRKKKEKYVSRWGSVKQVNNVSGVF